MSVIDILVRYHPAFLGGLFVTLKLCAVVWFTGIVGGTLLGALGKRWPRVIGIPSRAASFFLSGIPVLVLLFWFHYPLQAMIGINIDPFITAVTAFSLINLFAVADIIRGVLNDFPAQYTMAARVCGLSTRTTFLRIELPIVFRQVLPTLLMLQVTMLQISIFASLISVAEIFRVAQQINAMLYKPIEIYSALAVFFLLVCLPLNGCAIWLRSRFTRDYSEQ